MSFQTKSSEGAKAEIWSVHKLPREERDTRRGRGASSTRPWPFLPNVGRQLSRVRGTFKKLTTGLPPWELEACVAYIWGFDSMDEMHQALPIRAKAMELCANAPIMGGRDPENDLFCFDEFLMPDALEARRCYQAQRLYEWVDLELDAARALIDALRPSGMIRSRSAERPLTPYSWQDSKGPVTEDPLAINPLDQRWIFIPPEGFAKRKRRELQKLEHYLSPSVAKRCLAFIYGHRSANALDLAREGPARDRIHYTFDEDLGLEDLQERRAFQVDRAMMVLSIDEHLCRMLIARLSPSARHSADSATPIDPEADHDNRVWRRLNKGA